MTVSAIFRPTSAQRFAGAVACPNTLSLQGQVSGLKADYQPEWMHNLCLPGVVST